jgi:hypothetical protein
MLMQSEQINELALNLAKAQSEMGVAELNATNPFFKSKYANFEGIVAASRPALTKYNLSVIHQACKDESGQDYLYAILMHSSGQYIKSGMRINPVKTDIQSIGGYWSYAKRYTYAAITGCQVGDPDNDGETEMQEVRNKISKNPFMIWAFGDDACDNMPYDKLASRWNLYHGDIFKLPESWHAGEFDFPKTVRDKCMPEYEKSKDKVRSKLR